MHQTAPSRPTFQCSFPISGSRLSQSAREGSIQPGQRQPHETGKQLAGWGGWKDIPCGNVNQPIPTGVPTYITKRGHPETSSFSYFKYLYPDFWNLDILNLETDRNIAS